MKTNENLKKNTSQVLRIAANYGVRNIRVFGSVARGESGDRSDIDLLVTLDRGVTLMKVSALKRELEKLLGCKVDIVSDKGLRKQIRETILTEAVPLGVVNDD